MKFGRLVEATRREFVEGSEELRGRYGCGLSAGFVVRNGRRNCVNPRESGTVWEMAATSLHDDVFLWFQRLSRASGPSLFGPPRFAGGTGCGRQKCRDDKRSTRLVGTPLMGETEELSALCGTLCSRWKGLITVRVNGTNDHAGARFGKSNRARLPSTCVGLGDAFHFFHEVFACAMRPLPASQARSV